jgi:putative transposase
LDSNNQILQCRFIGLNKNSMPHSFNRIWIHAIWSTKERQPLISNTVENGIYRFLQEELIELSCPVRIVNGMPDHVHSLFLLNPQKSVSDIVKYVKGISSHSINEQNLISEKFSWQTGYAAYSVSESQLEKVFQYIKNQKQHHLKKTFLQEYNELLALHGLADV